MAGDGARRRRGPRRAGRARRWPAAGRSSGAACPGRRGPRRRAYCGDRAPGRQAVQRPGDARRHGEAGGLRHRPCAGLDDDGVRSGVGFAGVPRARSGVRPSRHRGQRRLVARRDVVPGPHWPAAVRHLRQRPVGHVPHRARGAAPPSRRRLARGPAGDDDGHRSRGPLADEPRARLPLGRAACRRGAVVAHAGARHDRGHRRHRQRSRRHRHGRRAGDPPRGRHHDDGAQRSWLLPALLALAVLVVGVALGWLLLRPDSTPTADKPTAGDSSKPTKSPSRTRLAHRVGVRPGPVIDPVDHIAVRAHQLGAHQLGAHRLGDRGAAGRRWQRCRDAYLCAAVRRHRPRRPRGGLGAC